MKCNMKFGRVENEILHIKLRVAMERGGGGGQGQEMWLACRALKLPQWIEEEENIRLNYRCSSLVSISEIGKIDFRSSTLSFKNYHFWCLFLDPLVNSTSFKCTDPTKISD